MTISGLSTPLYGGKAWNLWQLVILTSLVKIGNVCIPTSSQSLPCPYVVKEPLSQT